MLVASSLVHRWRHLLDGGRTSQSTSTKHGATARPRLLNSADRSEIVEMGIWCANRHHILLPSTCNHFIFSRDFSYVPTDIPTDAANAEPVGNRDSSSKSLS